MDPDSDLFIRSVDAGMNSLRQVQIEMRFALEISGTGGRFLTMKSAGYCGVLVFAISLGSPV